MKRVAIIGGGISGLSIAQCLKSRYEVRVFEKESQPGGLIKCDRVQGHLYHKVGGHVFNSRRTDVLDWFWNFFDRETEFLKAQRNAIIAMPNGRWIGYPIENHIYQMAEPDMKAIIADLMQMAKGGQKEPSNFEEFLKTRFGTTLYHRYFKPYNEKIWKKSLNNVPLSWLEGKLPMPTLDEIIFNNFNHVKETNMVHSTFYYAKQGGSQFLSDRLAQGLAITYNAHIEALKKEGEHWIVASEPFDKVVFCGNLKALPNLLGNALPINQYLNPIGALEYHGTTSVLCEIEANPYSWVYLPDQAHASHRIICTGNFAPSNNAAGKTTATIEFTDYVGLEEIQHSLTKLPLAPNYITHHYTEYTYPIQDSATRATINQLKADLKPHNLHLLGRFAEWEYYNMDAAIGAALDLSKTF